MPKRTGTGSLKRVLAKSVPTPIARVRRWRTRRRRDRGGGNQQTGDNCGTRRNSGTLEPNHGFSDSSSDGTETDDEDEGKLDDGANGAAIKQIDSLDETLDRIRIGASAETGISNGVNNNECHGFSQCDKPTMSDADGEKTPCKSPKSNPARTPRSCPLLVPNAPPSVPPLSCSETMEGSPLSLDKSGTIPPSSSSDAATIGTATALPCTPLTPCSPPELCSSDRLKLLAKKLADGKINKEEFDLLVGKEKRGKACL
jgi:hypothetical protein